MPPSPTKKEESCSTYSNTAPTSKQGKQSSTGVESNSKFREQFEASQTECEILRGQVLELRRNLEEQQDFIFSLQPHPAKITETEAKSEFILLCGTIEEWVDTNLGDAIQDRAMLKEKVQLGAAKRLLNMIPYSGREAFKYFDTDERNIAAVIMRYLCVQIFDREFYGPISPEETEYLRSIKRSMRHLNPPRSEQVPLTPNMN
jgi:hypothetical protein